MSDQSSSNKLLWMVIGVVVSGLVGIPVAYISGILTPLARLDISVSGPIPENIQAFPFGDRLIQVSVKNPSRFLTAKQTNIRITILRYDVLVPQPWPFHLRKRIWTENANSRKHFFAVELRADPACKQTATLSEGDPDNRGYSLSTVFDCGIIVAEQMRNINLSFAPDGLPETISVEAWFEGYSTQRSFEFFDSKKCNETIDLGGCYRERSTS
jgi:hypothetical protein